MRHNSRLEFNLKAEALKSGQQAVFGAFGMEAVEVVGALFAVGRAVADHDVGEGEDPVSDGDSGFLHACPAADTEEEGRKESAAAVDPRSSPGSLHENPADIAIALACAAGVAFTRARVVAGT